jgi:FKBP-type peptidyl-prolyl cis-trans isomerase FkpA
MKHNIKTVSLIIIVLIAASVTACNPAKKFQKEEQQQIDAYLALIPDTIFTVKPSGLYFHEIVAGTGRTPVVGDTVAFWYKARFLNGSVLDTNFGTTSPYYFIVGSNEVILGIDEGVRYMKQGGKAIFITPSPLAYGAIGSYPYIPGYTPFRWDVQISKVNSGTK